jgi:hypothetical protein
MPDNVMLCEAAARGGVFRDEVALLTPSIACDPTDEHPFVASRQGATVLNQQL